MTSPLDTISYHIDHLNIKHRQAIDAEANAKERYDLAVNNRQSIERQLAEHLLAYEHLKAKLA